jgi:adhesin transport system outer membrane protein
MNAAIRQSAAVSASIENLRAARSRRRCASRPTSRASRRALRSGAGNNFDGIRDQKRDSTAEIVLNWNLYNGGADQARVRQQLNVRAARPPTCATRPAATRARRPRSPSTTRAS